MSTLALAIASSFWWRHRRGFIVAAVSLLATAIFCPLLLRYSHAPAVLVACAVPQAFIIGYVLNALLFVEESGSMSSSYPRHMLALPVRIQTLVFWPILYASSTAALLWMAVGSIYRMGGFQTPLLLQALGLASLISWCQALSWLPIKSPWLRTAVALGSVLVLGALPLWLGLFNPYSPSLLAALLVGYIVAAYAVGFVAVANHRRGNDWRIAPGRIRPAQSVSLPAASERHLGGPGLGVLTEMPVPGFVEHRQDRVRAAECVEHRPVVDVFDRVIRSVITPPAIDAFDRWISRCPKRQIGLFSR
jgi:hypothetical protein